MSTEATINLFQEIPILLSITDKEGNPIPGAVLSNVTFSLDANIGEISPDQSNPNKWIFKPSQAGVTHIIATALVTVP